MVKRVHTRLMLVVAEDSSISYDIVTPCFVSTTNKTDEMFSISRGTWNVLVYSTCMHICGVLVGVYTYIMRIVAIYDIINTSLKYSIDRCG